MIRTGTPYAMRRRAVATVNPRHPDPPDHRLPYATGRAVAGGLFVASVHVEYNSGGLRQALCLPDRTVGAVELFSWRFRTTVIIGACWLARMDSARTGDALGFALPVLTRGARTLISGLFGVYDEATAEIRSYTYEHSQQLPIVATLRKAQLVWRNEHRHFRSERALAHWAGLTAIGVHS